MERRHFSILACLTFTILLGERDAYQNTNSSEREHKRRRAHEARMAQNKEWSKMVEFLCKNVETLAILVTVCVTLCDLQKLKRLCDS